MITPQHKSVCHLSSRQFKPGLIGKFSISLQRKDASSARPAFTLHATPVFFEQLRDRHWLVKKIALAVVNPDFR